MLKSVIDISEYAINNSKPEIRDRLKIGNAINLPWEANTFDLVISITTLHNLHAYDLDLALRNGTSWEASQISLPRELSQ